MKKFSIIAAALFVSLFLASNAYAYMNLAFDLSAITGGSGTTDLFNEMNLDIIHATSNYNSGFQTGSFNDFGHFRVSSLQLGSPVNDLGLSLLGNPAWELTGKWENLNGSIISNTVAYGTVHTVIFDYTEGSLSMFAHMNTASYDLAVYGPDDEGYDGDTDSTFIDGDQVASLSLANGKGLLLVDMPDPSDPTTWSVITGSTTLNWDFDTALDGFWSNGTTSIADQLEAQGFSTTFTNVKGVTFDVAFGADDKIHSNNDGSAKVGVPEPASMLLLGMGVAGLAMFRRKRAA